MDPLIGAALVTGIGGLASGLASSQMSYDQSKKLMHEQYDLQQKAIDKMNLYNTPAEQMKRLQAAGLNPNLVYGSGVDGNQSTSGNPSIANRNIDLGNPLGDAVQAYQQQKAVEQNVKESESRQALNNAKVLGVLADNRWKDETMDARIKEASQKLANMVADENYTVTRTDNLMLERDNIMQEFELLKSKTKLTDAQLRTEICRPAEVKAHAELMRQQASTSAKQRDLYDSIIHMNDFKCQQLLSSSLYMLSRAHGQNLENQLTERMQSIGLQGMSPKDLLGFLKDLVLSFLKSK